MAAKNPSFTHPRQIRLMENFVYILGTTTPNGPLTYVGWTNDLEARLEKHNSGTGAKSTRGKTWIMLYAERCETRNEAMSREWHLKRDKAFRQQLRQTCLAA